LERIANDADDPFHRQIPQYDIVFTYGGGPPVVAAYEGFGARLCVPIYNGLDPTTHHPAAADPRFCCDLGLVANRLPDRERRIEEFFLAVAAELHDRHFLLAGAGWADKPMPQNVGFIGHLYTADHNAFNASCLAVLNVSRDSMASNGYSPATRVFEAAGAGACLITDAWQGIEVFFEPDREILVAENGPAVAEHLAHLSPAEAGRIGDAARRRALAEHTYTQRVRLVEDVLAGRLP
ncbi:MAG: glycosyltransferase, partial [Alphaproteobacteria bacterium]|nr:glycosyltransferase [Alphaproteobacteria bacterium]